MHEFGDSAETFGVEEAEEPFHDVQPHRDWLFVASDSGTVYKYDSEVTEWTAVDVADGAVRALAGSPF